MNDVVDTPKKEFLTPARLRIMLTISLVLIALAMAGIFSVAQNILKSRAKIVSAAAAQSQNSADLVQSLDNTKRQLAKNKSAIERASAIVAESKQYQYQNQIITDLTRFASANGVTITSITFPTGTTGSATGGAATSGTPATAAPTTAAPSGVKSITASIAIKSPVNYASFLNFVNAIQNNLTKMQVSNLSLTPGDGGISSQTLNIQVYVR